MLLHYTIVVAVVAGRQPMIPWSVNPVSTLVFAILFPSAPHSVLNTGITLVALFLLLVVSVGSMCSVVLPSVPSSLSRLVALSLWLNSEHDQMAHTHTHTHICHSISG